MPDFPTDPLISLEGAAGRLGLGFLLADAHDQIQTACASAATRLGLPLKSILGRPLSDLIGLRPSVWSRVAKEGPLRLLLDSPRTAPARPTLEVLVALDQTVAGLTRMVLLLPERDRAAFSERSGQSAARPLVDEALLRLDASGQIVEASASVEALLGYPPAMLVGLGLNRLLEDSAARADDSLKALPGVQDGVVSEALVPAAVARTRDGATLPVALRFARFGSEPHPQWIVILSDLRALRAQEERLLLLSSAVEQTPAGILITDLKGRVDYVNEGFTALTGFPREQVLGRNLLAPGSVLPAFARHPALGQRILETRRWEGEIRGVTRLGDDFAAMVTFSPLQGIEHEVSHLLCRIQDVTTRVRDQEALEVSEARFSAVARLVGEWLWEQDASGFFTYCSEAVESILGYRPQEVVGHHYQEFMTDADRARWAKVLPPPDRVQRPFHRLINHYRHRKGHEVYTESSGAPIRDEAGRVIRWRGVDRDITEGKRQQDQIRLRERAIEAASVGIAIASLVEGDYPITYANPALSLITGYPMNELLGKNLRILQGQGTDEKDRDMIRKALKAGVRCEVVIRNYRKDGQSFWNELQLSPVHDERGRISHYIGIITDVTERLRAEGARHELSVARQIQLSLLPKQPLLLEDVAAAGLCISASQVGGDYYDIIEQGDFVDLVVADVSGHSVGAALIMSEMRSTLKAELRRADPMTQSVAELLTALNELLFADLDGAELFITLFYMRYQRSTRQLRFASAGHNPPLLLRNGAQQIESLDAEGMILGVRKDIQFEERSLALEPGDRLLLYTDGAVEAQDPSGRFFGLEELEAGFLQLRKHHPESTLENLLDRLRAFVGDAYFVDDVTLAVFFVQENSGHSG